MKVAIVGMGPKGLEAASELATRWSSTETLELYCYEPNEVGAGIAYAADQPNYLLLNVSPTLVRVPPLPVFDRWLREEGVDPTQDIPRATVGRYLKTAWAQLPEYLSPHVEITHCAEYIERLERVDGGWLVHGDQDQLVDEVLLSTGHAPSHDDALKLRWDPDQHTRLVSQVYPVATHLTMAEVPAGSVVLVRGAGLTFIDAMLALTEGRERKDWPAKIYPLSRTGHFLHSQPAFTWEMHPEDEEVLRRIGAQMEQTPDGVMAAVRQAAAEMLEMVGVDPEVARSTVDHTLDTSWEPQEIDLPDRGTAELNRSIAVAEYAETPGPAWALGRVWRNLLNETMESLAFSEADQASWERFRSAWKTLDRFSYGPGLTNAIRLADLCQKKVVDTRLMEAGITITDRVQNLPEDIGPIDVVIDAVTAPPGAVTARTPLVDELLGAGIVTNSPGCRGLSITREAQCLGPDGTPVQGLSAQGRLVQDVALTPDTLERDSHSLAARWAQRLVRQHRERATA